ncbi:MAG: DUF3306 domain-containing protein [Gammaproteobacteria bacterium]
MTRSEQPRGGAADARDGSREPEGFLDRWARRKRAAALGQGAPEYEQEALAPEPGTSAGNPSATPGGGPNPPHAEAPAVLTDADMPPIETLDEHSDYSGFFSPKVSEALRKTALRKLFRSSVFNVRDGLDDYDDDFRTFAPLGDMVTSDMRYSAEVEARLKAASEAEEPAAHTDAAGVKIPESERVDDETPRPSTREAESAPRSDDPQSGASAKAGEPSDRPLIAESPINAGTVSPEHAGPRPAERTSSERDGASLLPRRDSSGG